MPTYVILSGNQIVGVWNARSRPEAITAAQSAPVYCEAPGPLTARRATGADMQIREFEADQCYVGALGLNVAHGRWGQIGGDGRRVGRIRGVELLVCDTPHERLIVEATDPSGNDRLAAYCTEIAQRFPAEIAE